MRWQFSIGNLVWLTFVVAMVFALIKSAPHNIVFVLMLAAIYSFAWWLHPRQN